MVTKIYIYLYTYVYNTLYNSIIIYYRLNYYITLTLSTKNVSPLILYCKYILLSNQFSRKYSDEKWTDEIYSMKVSYMIGFLLKMFPINNEYLFPMGTG